MNPKEKSEELIEKYSPLVTNWDCRYDSPRNPDLVRKDAKECAVIFVEYMIEELEDRKEYIDDNFLFDWNNIIKYWRDVKIELI